MNSTSKASMQSMTVRGHVQLLANGGAEDELPIRTLRGQDHLVVPCDMLVEGVLHSSNAADPALALASEFGAIPAGWNGRPVVYNHPVVDNEAVSANRPDGWDNEVIGYVFNSALDDKTLTAELWLDTSRTPTEVLDGLKAGDVFEVSTGLFALTEDRAGFYGKEYYAQIWRNVVPDHLAILEKGAIGACSVEDGCGTSISRPTVNSTRIYTMSAQNRGSTSSSVQVPAKANESAASPAPCGCSDLTNNTTSGWKKIPAAIQLAVNKFLDSFKSNELSDNDIRRAIAMALNELEGFAYASVEAVYDKFVIFSAMSREDYEWKMYQLDYGVVEGGAITLGSNPIAVRPETSYVPVVVTEAAGNPPVVNSVTPTTKEDSMDLTEDQLTAIANKVAAAIKPVESSTPVANAAPAPAATLEALLANASPELAASVTASVTAANAMRTNAVSKLVAQGYTEAELAGISLDTLAKMAANKAAPAPTAPQGAVDFSGLAVAPIANAGGENFTAPTKVFPLKSAA